MPIKIAVYAIALNEIKHVDRWWASVKDADVICVADTGSTDGTAERLASLGCSVSKICVSPWRFDVARNAGLALVPGDVDVCVCVDLDDTLAEGWRGRLEAAWVPGVTTKATYTERNGQHEYIKDRCHARHGYFWHCICHEVVGNDTRVPESRVNVPGPFYLCAPDLSKDRTGYLPLLKAEMDEAKSPRSILYYARELTYAGKWAEALPEYVRYVELPASEKPAWEDCFALRACLDCLQHTGTPLALLLDCPHARMLKHRHPGIRETWSRLASIAYAARDWKSLADFCDRGLAVTHRLQAWTDIDACWTWLLHDYRALAADNMGDGKTAVAHGALALAASPGDARLATNLEWYKKLAGKPVARRLVFHLTGGDQRHLCEMTENVRLARLHYPGWDLVVEVPPGTSPDWADSVRDLGATVSAGPEAP